MLTIIPLQLNHSHLEARIRQRHSLLRAKASPKMGNNTSGSGGGDKTATPADADDFTW